MQVRKADGGSHDGDSRDEKERDEAVERHQHLLDRSLACLPV